MRLTQSPFRRAVLTTGLLAMGLSVPALAQDDAEPDDAGARTRVGLGPQIYPSYPGSDEYDFGPMTEFERAKGGEPFDFEAPDDSMGFSLIDSGGFSAGPVVSWEGSRTAEDVGANLPKVK